MDGFKPTSTIIIDSKKLDKEKLDKIEKKLYGDTSSEPTLLLPNEILSIISGE